MIGFNLLTFNKNTYENIFNPILHIDSIDVMYLNIDIRDTGIGHLTKNYLRPIQLLPKKTSFREVQLLL